MRVARAIVYVKAGVVLAEVNPVIMAIIWLSVNHWIRWSPILPAKDLRLFVSEPISTARKQGKSIIDLLTQALHPLATPL